MTSCCLLCNPLQIIDRQSESPASIDESSQEAEETIEENEPFAEPAEADLINPEAFRLSSIKVAGQAIDVKVQGSWAYLTNDVGTLYVIDISDKKNPVITGKLNRLNSANIVIIKEDHVFISYTEYKEYDEEGFQERPVKECGFVIINVRDKANPEYKGKYISGSDTDKTVQGLFINGDYAYVSSNQDTAPESQISKLEIVSIKDSQNPKLTGEIRLNGSTAAVFVQNDCAYMNSNFFSDEEEPVRMGSILYIIDIKDKTTPQLIGQCSVYSNSWAIHVTGEHVFLSSNNADTENAGYRNSKLMIVDISDKKNPKEISSCDISGGAWEMDYEDNHVFISNLNGGLSIIDIEDKKNPRPVFNLKTRGSSYDIAVSGFYGYLVDGFSGLVIIELKNRASGIDSENRPPVSVIDIVGDNFGNEDMPVFKINNPVYFSAKDSFDPEGENIKIKWDINPENTSQDSFIATEDASGEKMGVIFKKEGTYSVSLEVSDGIITDSISKKIIVKDVKPPIDIKKSHDFNIEIEYVLKNTGQADLENLRCFISVPQNIVPYQSIKNLRIKGDDAKISYYYDEDWNLLAEFEFAKQELKPENEIKAAIEVTVEMPEFYYNSPGKDALYYEEGDKDIDLYTSDDFFIDSDNPVIIDKTLSVIGNEKNPYEIAKKIYNFVIKTLKYDFYRADDKNYDFMYASEILDEGKGVCLDYAILYTAMLRAAKIPARLAGGIPVTAILLEDDKEINIGHEWVEIKLPDYGWIPVDPTAEDIFLSQNYYLNLVTDKGMSLLYSRETMDWSSYYYEGFKFSWDSDIVPKIEQEYNFRASGIDIKDLFFY
ncbi:MAG: transglutaminase domain-containing protein [Actinomycetota bacterium]|nr:transglutaminase domain-containing protein [Actinomycetota bacterium]